MLFGAKSAQLLCLTLRRWCARTAAITSPCARRCLNHDLSSPLLCHHLDQGTASCGGGEKRCRGGYAPEVDAWGRRTAAASLSGSGSTELSEAAPTRAAAGQQPVLIPGGRSCWAGVMVMESHGSNWNAWIVYIQPVSGKLWSWAYESQETLSVRTLTRSALEQT